MSSLSCRTATIAIEIAAKSYDVSCEDILSKSKRRKISSARQYAMWILREWGYSFPQIGFRLKRNHATVIFGVNAFLAREHESLSTDFTKTVDGRPIASIAA